MYDSALIFVYEIKDDKGVMFDFVNDGDITVDWGDGTRETESFKIIGRLSHKYMNEGTFTIRITGKVSKIIIISRKSLIR